MKKTIIFDFDGTLADTLPLVVDLLYSLLIKRGMSLSKSELTSLIQNTPIELLLKQYHIPKLLFYYKVLLLRRKMKKRILETRPFKGAQELLLTLRENGHELYLVSSNSKKVIEPFLEKHDLNFFEEIYDKSSHFQKEKTILKLIKTKNCSFQSSCYVGDELRDIKACDKINLDCIVVDFGFNSRELLEESSSNVVSSYEELLLKLNGVN